MVLLKCEQCGDVVDRQTSKGSEVLCERCASAHNDHAQTGEVMPRPRDYALSYTPIIVADQPRSHQEKMDAAYRHMLKEPGGCLFTPLYVIALALSISLGTTLTFHMMSGDIFEFSFILQLARITVLLLSWLVINMILYFPLRLLQRVLFKADGWF